MWSEITCIVQMRYNKISKETASLRTDWNVTVAGGILTTPSPHRRGRHPRPHRRDRDLECGGRHQLRDQPRGEDSQQQGDQGHQRSIQQGLGNTRMHLSDSNSAKVLREKKDDAALEETLLNYKMEIV